MADHLVDIPKTLGALLLGGLFAAFLSGGVSVQVLIYFKLYPSDLLRVKTLVVTVWFLDTLHTGFIWSALFHYLIFHFGDRSEVDFIAWNLAITITFTALLTFLVHCFLAHRIWMLSKNNWLLTIPILTLAVLRLVSANATTGEMIRLESFHSFKQGFKWMFTLGLALSSTVDILITVSLFFLLHGSRTGTPSLNIVIDSLIKYAFETGALTSAGTIVSMLCWLIMPQNLVFMGIHFVISKFYATSLLVTLNTRQEMRRARSPSPSRMSGFPIVRLHGRRPSHNTLGTLSEQASVGFENYKSQKQLEISVMQSVEHNVDEYEEPISFRRTEPSIR